MLEPKEKNIKVERVRQVVCADLQMRPQFGRRKIYLIAADYLNEQGQNALLKSLEEPPDYCFFLLTVIGAERLLPTILSRVSLIPLRRYSVAEIACILTASGCQTGNSQAFYARFAGGLAGVAIDLAASNWFGDLRAETITLFKDLAVKNRTSLLTAGFQFFDTNRPHTPAILDILGSLIRDQLVYVSSRQPDLLTNQDLLPLLTQGPFVNKPASDVMKRLTRAHRALIAARRGLSLNASYEGLVCNLLLNLRKEFQYA